jgi:hypothetical protein
VLFIHLVNNMRGSNLISSQIGVVLRTFSECIIADLHAKPVPALRVTAAIPPYVV